MSSTETLCINTALPPQNGDQPVDGVREKPVEEPAAVANAATAAADDNAKSAPIDDILPEQDEKLDEFARLELELAELNKSTSISEDPEDNKLNNGQPASEGVGGNKTSLPAVNSQLVLQSEMHLIEKDLLLNADETAASQNGQTSEATSGFSQTHNESAADVFDHEDLIAVLKGESTDEPTRYNKPKDVEPMKTELPSSSKANIEHLPATSGEFEGVTIEGEGEYQIMEVVDDFEDELETNVIATTQPLAVATNKSPPSQKLTREEERAVAMEQIAGLKRAPRRRKQDIKPLPFETSELVSTIGADWSDDGDDAEVGNSTATRPSTSKSTSSMKTIQNTNVSDGGTQSAHPTSAVDGSIDAKAAGAGKAGARKRRRSTGANVTSVIVLPPQQDSSTSNRKVDESQNSPATGFKRTRTIKRRIIWDPDAPETAISYADLVRSKSKDRQSSISPNVAQKSRSVTPKEKLSAIDTTTSDKKAVKRAVTPSVKSIAPVKDKTDNLETKSTGGKQVQRRAQTTSPVANGGSTTATTAHTEPRKKKISEIDILMGDEGVASMLSSLESGRSKMADNSDGDKPHRPLMRSRTAPTEKANKRENTTAVTAAGTTVPSSPPAKKPRVPKAKPSAAWDYVYQKKQQVSDDSMIIRRRSNSSYSSNASQHRLSIDGPVIAAATKTKAKSIKSNSEDDSDATAAERPTKKDGSKSAAKATAKDISNSPPSAAKISGGNIVGNKRASPTGENSKSFEFIKPKETKKNTTGKTPNRRSTIVGNLETTLNADMKKTIPKRGRPSMVNKQKDTTQSTATTAATANASTFGSSTDADAVDTNIVVRKIAKIAQVVFSTHASKISGTFTPELMNQIVDALDTLSHDANCNVVVLLTNGPDFCRGLDLSSLATGGIEQRKTAAVSLATAAKNLLKTIATFPKPLVAGINGSVVGLGVTLLPLFDVVISSDKATLETPYAKIGQVPEGFCIWQNLWNIRTTAKTKLFWLAEKLISTEAASAGLVTKLTTADKVNDDAIATAKKMSSMSIDAYRYMKKATIQSRLDVVISAIDDEFEEIVKQWTSAECCIKIKKYIESGGHFTLSPKHN